MQSLIGNHTFVQRLRLSLFFDPAGLEQQYLQSAGNEFQRDRNAGRTRADDAQIGDQRLAIRQFVRFNYHHDTSKWEFKLIGYAAACGAGLHTVSVGAVLVQIGGYVSNRFLNPRGQTVLWPPSQ